MSMLHTPTSQFLVKQAINPQDASTGDDAITGTGVDCLGYEVALFVLGVGAVAANAGTKSVSFQIQESSDDGDSDTYADLTDATTGAVANAGQNEPYLIEVNLSEVERYLRVIVDGGSGDGGLVSGHVLLMQSRHQPPTQDNTVVRYGFS